MTNIKKVKIGDLIPDDNNANLGTERGRAMIEKSIQELGFGRSLVVDRNGKIIAGNKSHEVAGAVGLEDVLLIETDGSQVVAIMRTDLDLDKDAKAKQLAVVDNRSSEVSLKWDAEVLLELDQTIDLSPFFTDIELNELSLSLDDENGEGDRRRASSDDDEIEEVESRVKPGEIWQLGRHFIACADCTIEENVRKLLGFVGGRSPDLVFSDPPYGINIVATNVPVGGGEAYDIPFGGAKNRNKGYVGGGNCRRTSIEECRRRKEQSKKVEGLGSIGGAKPFGSKKSDVTGSIGASNVVAVNKYAPIIGDDSIDTAVKSSSLYLRLFPDAFHCWWGGNYYAAHLPNSSCWIVWDKQNTGHFADAELAWTNSDTAVRIFQHMWNGMLKDSEKGVRRVHPSQKPIALYRFVAEKYGKPNDLTIDPFLGSGISILGAEEMEGDRVTVGFEMSVDYCEIICQRYEKMGGDRPKRVGSI